MNPWFIPKPIFGGFCLVILASMLGCPRCWSFSSKPVLRSSWIFRPACLLAGISLELPFWISSEFSSHSLGCGNEHSLGVTRSLIWSFPWGSSCMGSLRDPYLPCVSFVSTLPLWVIFLVSSRRWLPSTEGHRWLDPGWLRALRSLSLTLNRYSSLSPCFPWTQVVDTGICSRERT